MRRRRPPPLIPLLSLPGLLGSGSEPKAVEATLDSTFTPYRYCDRPLLISDLWRVYFDFRRDSSAGVKRDLFLPLPDFLAEGEGA